MTGDRLRSPALLWSLAAAGAIVAFLLARRRQAEVERRTEARLHPRADFEVSGGTGTI